MRRYLRQINTAIIILLLISLVQPGLLANAAVQQLPATAYGTVIDVRKAELAPGAVYSWMDLQNERGRQKIHTVEFDPQTPGLALRAGTKGGKVYGMKAVTEMAAYTDAPGNRVVAGINGDFYEISGFATGVPNGLFMDGGKILNSGGGGYTFGLKADGSSIYGAPKLTRTVTVGGKTTNLTSINRYRNTDQLVLYTADYNTSTKSTAEGDEIVLDIVAGEVKSGQTLKLKVAEIRSNQGDTPLTAGKVVLSAHGTSRAVLAGLAAGDEITASFALDAEWSDVLVAIGGAGPLVKDGTVQNGVGPEGVHPRTAIGTKADGSIVLFEVDGRAPGFSEGVETDELGQILKELGVVNAMNLDGGGSSTFAARMPGTTGVKMLNQGSDGYERKTGNGLLLVNTAPELPAASKLVIQPNAERILQGASYTFTAAGVDQNGHPAPYAGTLDWQVDPALGGMDAAGVFTAGPTAAAGTITAAAGSIQGSGEIEVVDKLTALKFPDDVKTYASGVTEQLSVKALRDGQTIQADNDSFEWRVEGEVGTVDENGIFRATDENGKNGKIYAKYGEVETSFEVNVGLPPVLLEDFEAGIGKYKASSAAAVSTSIAEVTDQDFIRSGSKALKLEYDFTGKTGTSGAYLTAVSTADRIQIPGYPEKIGMWIYGDGQKHWLRGQIRDGNNAAIAVNFTEQGTGVDWKGWKYVEVSVPKGKTTPLTMDMPVRYMETSNLNKNAGAIYVDDIRAVYGPLNEDQTPPVIKNEYPAANEIVKMAAPTLSIIGEDDGYDPLVHPGTTLIDPDKIRVYVDDQQVEHGFYPPKGQITYKPKVPLAEGRHKVKVAIRDLSGNQTIKEWYFTVNLGSPYYVYQTPETVYAGNTYTLDVTAEKADKLQEGHVAFAFDPAAVTDLQVIRGSKLAAGQLEPVIDAAQGTVRLNLSRVNEAQLGGNDLIGQIQYTIRNDYVGPYTLEQAAGEVSKPFVIENTSGSVVSAEGSGAPISFIGAPVESTVKTQLKLTWDHYGIAKGYAASFKVQEMEGGAAAQGAKLLINGVEAPEALSGTDGILTTAAATQSEGTFTLQAVRGSAYSPVMTFKVAPVSGTAAPRNVNVTMGADAATSRQFTWQTDPQTTDTVLHLVKQAEFAGFDGGNVLRIEGSNSIYNTNNDGTMRVHKAEAVGLEPGTAYVYRVGDGKTIMSSQGTFTTSGGAGDTTKFLFIGDSQADSKAGFELWRTTVQKAFAYMPDAEMLVHAGDMVDKGFEQEQWNWWFEAAQEQLLQTTLVPIIGNHEVMGTNGDGDYLAQFNNPQNGAAGLKGTNFSFDIKDTHFAVLNTEHSAAEFAEQAEWLDQDLSNSDKKWKVVFFHQGPYGSIYSNERVQSTWVPVFDKHNVDLVMNGHDHIYLRTYPMKGGKQVSEGAGTRYVIGGSSGPKFYALTPRFWQEKIYDEDEQIFTAVEIDGDGITVTARTVDGAEIDRLVIAKAPESITLDRTAVELEPGQSIQLHAAVHPNNASAKQVKWSVISDTPQAAATVDAFGLVTGVHPGTAKVRAAVEGYPDLYAESTITVDALQSITLQGQKLLKPGAQDRAVPEAVYASGRQMAITEGLHYSSQNEQVATVDADGLVQALDEGSTVISVTYREFKAQYGLTVSSDAAAVVTGIEIKGPVQLRPGAAGTAVVQAVYSDGSFWKLAEGVVYDTSNHAVAVISGSGEITALSAGRVTVSAVYEGWRAEYALTVTEDGQGPSPVPTPEPTPTQGPIPEPAPTPEPTPTPEPAPGVAPGPTGTAAQTAVPSPTPAASAAPGVVMVTASQLAESRNALGEAVVTAAGELAELVLPGNAAELLGGAPLRVDAAGLSVKIPAAVLAELSARLPAGVDAAGSTISLKSAAASTDATSALLSRAGELAGAQLRAVSTVRDWSLSITTDQGQTFALTQFTQPVTLSYEVSSGAERNLLGIYFISDAGQVDYTGGEWQDGKLSADVSHFSKYAVLEYDKSFNDLRPGHWAISAVKQLAAKQLVQGVSTERFEPTRAVTRAEFTSMLARALGLSGQGSSNTFADVAADSWYAEAVGQAAQAGIVNGVSASTFTPGAQISRQEMAVMLVRAYKYAAGGETSAAMDAAVVSYTDRSAAPQWAREAITQAASLSLMQGRTQGQFAPDGQGTRAESAQMIVNLLAAVR